MGRQYRVEAYLDLVARLSSAVPGISLTTDIIVGFCGETEAQFEAGFRQQAEWLSEAGVDGMIIETMMHLQEALCALRACREAGLWTAAANLECDDQEGLCPLLSRPEPFRMLERGALHIAITAFAPADLATVVPAVLAVFGFYVTGVLLAYQMMRTLLLALVLVPLMLSPTARSYIDDALASPEVQDFLGPQTLGSLLRISLRIRTGLLPPQLRPIIR